MNKPNGKGTMQRLIYKGDYDKGKKCNHHWHETIVGKTTRISKCEERTITYVTKQYACCECNRVMLETE